jgi:hypothetical protein
MTYDLICKNGHNVSLGPSELESILQDEDFICGTCGAQLQLDDTLSLICHICDQPWDVSSLEEGAFAISQTCSHCAEFTNDAFFHVPGSHFEDIAEYEWTHNGANAASLKRRGRLDYWEGLIHFCNRGQFVSIFRVGKILARATGYFKLPAVCLTETPSSECAELKKTHGDHGFVFRKSALMAVGGNPALYLREPLISAQLARGGFASEVQPFINLLRIPRIDPSGVRYDFLHEREWRVPGDIDLVTTTPFGVVIPDGPPTQRFGGRDGATILAAARRYDELG